MSEQRTTCIACGRPYATIHDFRAIKDNPNALDGLCPTGYAIRDPDAQSDCDLAAERRIAARIDAMDLDILDGDY